LRTGFIGVAFIRQSPGFDEDENGRKHFTGGQIVRQEQLIWMMGERYDIHRANPVPLALLPPGNVYRDYAIEGLKRGEL